MTTKKKTTKIGPPGFDRRAALAQARKAASKSSEVYFSPAGLLGNIYQERRPTGIVSLDFVLRGGYPKGCNVQLTGLPNAGKDFLLNLAIRENQLIEQENSAVAIIYLEGQWDKDFARLLGASVAHSDEELALKEEKSGHQFSAAEKKKMKEQVGALDIFFASTQEAVQDLIIDLLDTGAYQILVVNSIDNLVPSKEADTTEKDGAQGAAAGQSGRGRAKLLSEHFRRQNVVMNTPITVEQGGKTYRVEKDTTVFWVSQKRTEQKGMYTGLGTTGGYALRHNAALILDVIRSKEGGIHLGPDNPKDPNYIPIADDVLVIVTKGKYGVQDGGRTEFRLYKRDHYAGSKIILAGTVDDISGIRIALAQAGLLRKVGGKYTLFPPNREPIPLGTSRMLIDAEIRDNPEVQQTVKEAIHAHLYQIRENGR